MIYHEIGGTSVSSLGMGCMRLPTDDAGEIDVNATREMVAYALEKGVNYFDTAWGYHVGRSESVMGEVLSEYPRDRYLLTSKFPGFSLENMERVEEIFETQLKKCRTDYFDFYLFHNLCESNVDWYLDPKYGLFDYLVKQKENGRIRHLGFSVHASLETMKRFLDAYGHALEFGQIQLNYMDWDFQDAKAKVRELNARGLSIIVMEPVRGGKLCTLGKKHEERLRALNPARTIPEWGFRFVQDVEGVAVTLSGMSNLEQLTENIRTFETRETLTDEERETLFSIAREMTANGTLPCTACRYCVSECPMALDIPWLIELYNNQIYSEKGFRTPSAFRVIRDEKKPSACIACRACEGVCPQNLRVSEMMADFTRRVSEYEAQAAK